MGETYNSVINGWIEQNRYKIDKDTLTYKTEGNGQTGLVNPGFYNEYDEKVIDLSSYNIMWHSPPFFINGYSVLDIENDQGARYMTVINKAGEQLAPPIKSLAHGNVVSGLFLVRNEDNTFSYMDTKMNVVIANIKAQSASDFTYDGIATIKSADETYYINTSGERIDIK